MFLVCMGHVESLVNVDELRADDMVDMALLQVIKSAHEHRINVGQEMDQLNELTPTSHAWLYPLQVISEPWN